MTRAAPPTQVSQVKYVSRYGAGTLVSKGRREVPIFLSSLSLLLAASNTSDKVEDKVKDYMRYM